ncbi:MAG TPA: hypothetical protein VLX60_00240 [Terriglobales bacterium]|nr:hypothetical protein [Terriglobales bacterium]
MGKRTCPLCFVRVPWTAVLAHSYEIQCTACHAPLELSRLTRIAGALGGMGGAFAAANLIARIWPGGLWVTQIVAATLGFGAVSAVCVMLAGDLVVRPRPPASNFPHPAE